MRREELITSRFSSRSSLDPAQEVCRDLEVPLCAPIGEDALDFLSFELTNRNRLDTSKRAITLLITVLQSRQSTYATDTTIGKFH